MKGGAQIPKQPNLSLGAQGSYVQGYIGRPMSWILQEGWYLSGKDSLTNRGHTQTQS